MLADGDQLSVQGLEGLEGAHVRHGRRGESRAAPQRILPTDAAVISMSEAFGAFSCTKGGWGAIDVAMPPRLTGGFVAGNALYSAVLR